ncbi:GntR family transcriptional regulator [Jannaschia seohaensis]|uniref:Regulatory GntR family protein n=1 Tax=Jannaschia seohaensis TaxID=475081 RepID=A0A2Y9AI96_9RHOB|nr:GntR family transcriptional regulator [Jannaschia seohaensis]PWJ20203.1 regulatory GntR family protein [Jannaschia seohaensis]SSA44191.1 regulatory protein, gntR family [Jannaschia seohaensis]
MTQREPATAEAGARPDRGGGLHDYLRDSIRDLILRGSLAAGARLAEAELCARFDVSRTPMREALKALSAEGLQPNRGATVAPLDPARLRDLFEAKGAIEHFIGLQSAVRASPMPISRICSASTSASWRPRWRRPRRSTPN